MMLQQHLLSILVFLPLLGALVLALIPAFSDKGVKRFAEGCSLLTLGVSLYMLRNFQIPQPGFQFLKRVPWMPQYGINYSVGVDGLSVSLIVLTTALTFLVVLASDSIHSKLRAYLVCMLALESGMLGSLVALDGITFYMFWELMLIPMYFLIGVWGGQRRLYAALKFVLYTALGSLLMLVAMVCLAYLYAAQHNGVPSFALQDWMTIRFAKDSQELLLFSAFALAFAIKIPMFPFHTWLPDAHVEAPTGGSVILAGVLLKLGLYGLIRFCVPIFPNATQFTLPLFALLGVVGIVFGALVAWQQEDMKKLVAYSSVSHLGFCVLGYSAMNIQGLQGAILQMINHGVSTAALFFVVGVLYDRKHTRLIADFGGVSGKLPLFSLVFLVFTLSSIGLPLTNGFVGEFLILLGSAGTFKTLSVVAVSGVVLGAMYMLSLYRRVSFGDFQEKKNGDLTDLNFIEKAVFAPLLAFVFILGLYPQPVLDLVQPSSDQVLRLLSPQNPKWKPFGKITLESSVTRSRGESLQGIRFDERSEDQGQLFRGSR